MDMHASSLVQYTKPSSNMMSLSSSSPSPSSADANGYSMSLLLSFSLESQLVALEMAGRASVNQRACNVILHPPTRSMLWIKLNMATNQGRHLFHWHRVSVQCLYESIQGRPLIEEIRYAESAHFLPIFWDHKKTMRSRLKQWTKVTSAISCWFHNQTQSNLFVYYHPWD